MTENIKKKPKQTSLFKISIRLKSYWFVVTFYVNLFTMPTDERKQY